MYKYNTLHPFVVSLIVHVMGEGKGALIRGGALILNFGWYEGHLFEGGLFEGGALIRGFTAFQIMLLINAAPN